jgi:hypothetical protein
MSDPIKVTIPSRGITLKFPGGSNPEQIKEAIDRDYPRDGRDVAYDIGQDPGYAEQMSLKEYEDLRKFKKENPANADQIWEGVRGLVSTIGSGLEKGGQAVANLDLMNAGEAVGRGVVTGVADLGDVINRITTWNSAPDTYEDFIAGKTNTPERRAEYDAKLKADFTDFKELQGYQAQRKNVVEKSPIPELTEAASVVADPTMLIPGAGEILGASKIAARGVGAVAKGVGEAARVITRPAAEVVERLSTVENPIIRGAAQLATPVTTGVEVADAIARGAVIAGENLVNAPTRIGPLESLGRTANATNVDRALASVGRYGGDKLIQGGLAAATGGVEGAVIGGTLGGLADGEEGFYSGLGAGMVAGAVGGAVGNAYYQLSGQARTDAALADFNRFRSQLDEPTRTKIDTVAERDGLNAVVGLMDGAGVLRGQFKDADVNFLNAEEFKAKHKGADARGVQLIEADRPIIDINVDHKRSDYTFGHEIFHALEQVEQLSPKIERLKQDIVGGFIQNPDGTYTQAQAGFLSPAEIEARHAEYTKKLASSGADASAWVNDANIGQKASRVASELGAEYMARLIAGSDPDAMLRGFDGLTRQIADHALLKMSNETLRGVAERLGTGTKPVESILFGGLKDAPPVVAAALRDVLRARKTMADRIELVDRSDRGLVIKPTDMTNPAAAELAVKAGIAVKDPSGAFRMRTDDEINKLEEVQAQAIKRVVESVPVADPSTPHLRVVDGNIVGGGISPEQAKAFLADPNLSNKVKESLGLIAGSMSNLNSGKGGNVLFIEYGPALRKIKSRITGKFRNAYSSGIRLTQREIAPFSLSFNKGDVPYINAVDVSKLLSKAGDRAAADKLGPYGRDFDGFVTDVVSYFENVSNPSGVRTAELPGMTADKATFLNQFFGSQAKGGAEFVRSFRLDRITEARETGKRVAASELAWQRQKINWLPAENLGDSKVFNSPDSGYRIISKSNNKHSLYAPTGERIGIYDTQAKAESVAQTKANPRVSEKNIPEPVVDADHTVAPGTPAPDSAIRDIPTSGAEIPWADSEINYQPSVLPEVFPDMTPKLLSQLERISPTLAAIHIDRMRVGSYKGIDLQGGFFYPAIVENLKKGVVWAFNSVNTASGVAKRAAANGGLVKLVLMQEGNVIGNKTFTRIWFNDLNENIAAGKISKSDALAKLNEIRQKHAELTIDEIAEIQLAKSKGEKKAPRKVTGHVKEWNNLKEAERAITDIAQQTRGDTYFQKKAEKNKIAYQALLSQKMTKMGFPDAVQIVRDIEEPAFKNVPKGASVGILKFDPMAPGEKIKTAKEVGVPEHYSYEYVLKGKPVAKIRNFKIIDEAFPATRNQILTQQNVDFPIRESIPAGAKQAHGTVNFMPGQAPSPAIKVLEELKRSNFVSDNIAKAALGSFPNYLKPVADFITEQREKLVNGKLTPRDIAKAYMVTVASQGTGAIFVKTIADKLALKGIAFEPSALFRTEDGKKIRPEEAASWWLGTENGKRALDNIEKGIVNPADWIELGEVRRAYGDDRFKTFRALNPENLANISKVTRELNTSNGNSSRVLMAVQTLNGISTGKKGFISHLLGLGDTPTIDAVEINFWLTGQGDIKALNTKKAELARKIKDAQSDRRVSGELFRRIDERIGALRGDVPGSDQVDPQVWAHILHHWLWDKAKGIKTTHAGMYEAQRNFQPAAPDTPAFNQWFGESKVVDGDGKPLVVYHGGSATNEFRPISFWTVSRPVADSYAAGGRSVGGNGGKVTEAFLSLQNLLDLSEVSERTPWQNIRPLLSDAGVPNRLLDDLSFAEEQRPGIPGIFDGNWATHEKEIVASLREAGYDGVRITEDDLPGFIVFDPTQIKSATGNRGTFDVINPDIRFQPAEKLPNGQAWSTDNKYRVIQKEGGKFRVYAPTGAMIGVADTLDKSKKLIEKMSR